LLKWKLNPSARLDAGIKALKPFACIFKGEFGGQIICFPVSTYIVRNRTSCIGVPFTELIIRRVSKAKTTNKL
jgi:hypothetical protein